MAKIERKFMAHFIDAAIPDPAETVTAEYVRLGKDLEEYSAELSAQVDKTKNILGETSVKLSSYEKQGTVEPYYAEKGDPLFERLCDIVDNQKVLDDCATTLVDVHLWEQPELETSSYPAIRWDAVIEVTSVGGDNTGLQIPFAVHYTGGSTKGTFDLTSKTFTPNA
ncbi:MAG TPA: hypothetical protein DEP23_09825 [Ruminococcaceae bacterium]|nr:hypothetical protein [Oscillospiraceae bacterium]